MGYKIHSMDVNNAFLQALLDEDIYVSQAEGFKTTPPSSVKLPYRCIVGALLWVALGQVNIIYVPTTDNLADFLTKAVPAIKLHGNKIRLNMIISG